MMTALTVLAIVGFALMALDSLRHEHEWSTWQHQHGWELDARDCWKCGKRESRRCGCIVSKVSVA